MKYIVSWTIPQATFKAGMNRFLEGGGTPPSGIKMLGRWHGTNAKGVSIVETNDAKALYAWMAAWADLLVIDITPCVDDAEAAAVLQPMSR